MARRRDETEPQGALCPVFGEGAQRHNASLGWLPPRALLASLMREDPSTTLAIGKGRRQVSGSPAANGETVLEAVGLTRSFGGVVALEGYSIRIRPGDLIGLIGPNGAGKTTVFNLLSGVLSSRRRPDLLARRRRDRSADPRHRPSRPRAHVSEHPAVSRSLGDRERHGRSAHAPRRGRVDDAARPAAVSPRRGDHPPARPRDARARRPAGAGTASGPAIWPMATSGGSRSPGRWRPSRACCCSTSPRPA